MADDSDKQAVIASDEGINQKQWMDEPDFGDPILPKPVSIPFSPGEMAALSKPGAISDERVESAIRAGLVQASRPPLHPSSRRALGGGMVSSPEARAQAREALVMAEMYPSGKDQWRELAAVHGLGKRDILTESDIEEAEAPSFWENIGTWFEPFTTPQRAAWYGALKLGEYLPDPGTVAGDIAQDVVGAVGGTVMALGAGLMTGLPILWDTVFGDDDEGPNSIGTPSSIRGTAEEFVLSFSDMVENLYRDVSTGELVQRAEQHIRPWLWGDWSKMPAPTGEMILNSLLSYDAAEHLSQVGSTAVHRKFGEWMSNDMGRLLMGIGLEVVADPLWAFGPAKAGGQLISVGGDTYRIGTPLAKAAGEMEILDRTFTSIASAGRTDRFKRVMHDLVKGSPEDIERAELFVARYADMAGSNAAYRKNLLSRVNGALKLEDASEIRKLVREIADERLSYIDDLALRYAAAGTDDGLKLAGKYKILAKNEATKIDKIAESGELTQKWLMDQTKVLPLEVRNAENIVDSLRNAVSFARKARANGPKLLKRVSKQGVVKEGGISWHLPFTTIQGSVDVHPVKKTVEMLRKLGPVDRAIDKVSDYSLSSLNIEIEAAIRAHGEHVTNLEAFNGNMTKSFAWAMQKVSSSAVVMGFHGWDMLRKAFGTRFVQPLTHSLHVEAIEKYSKLPSFSFRTTMIKRLKKAHPEVWESYQGGITKMLEAYTGLETNLRSTTMRLLATAEKTLKARREKSKGEVARLVRLRGETTDPGLIADLSYQIDEAKRWANKSTYGVTDIMNEAASSIEAGAGQFGYLLSDQAKEVSEKLRLIINRIVDNPDIKAGKITVEQALVQMVRLTSGSASQRGRLLADINALDQVMSSVNLGREKAIRKAKKAFHQRIVQIKTLEGMVESISVPELTKLLLSGRESRGADDLHTALLNLFGTKKAASSILRHTAVAMGVSDGYKAIRLLAEQLTGDLPKLVPGNKEELQRAIGIAIRDHLHDLRAESATLRNAWYAGQEEGVAISRATMGGDEFMPGMKAKEFNILVTRMAERERASWRLLVPEAERKHFIRWASQAGDVDGDLLRALTSAMPEGGATNWQEAFGFYRREQGLKSVQKTARRWKSKGFGSRDEVQKAVVPYASRYAREEAYRLADRAQDAGAVVPEGFVSPSSWRRRGGETQLDLDLRPPFEPFVPAAAGKDQRGLVPPLHPALDKNLKVQTSKVSNGLLGTDEKLGLAARYQEEFRTAIESIKRDLDPRRVRQSPSIDGLIISVTDVLKRIYHQRANPFPTGDDVDDLHMLLRDLGEWSKKGGIGREFKPSKELSASARALTNGLTGIRRTGKLDHFHSEFIHILNGLLSGGHDGVLRSLKVIKRRYGRRIELALPVDAPPIRKTPMAPAELAEEFRAFSRTDLLKGMTEGEFLGAVTKLLSDQGITDPKLQRLLSEVARRAKTKKTLAEMTPATITADVKKIKEDMLSLISTKGKGRGGRIEGEFVSKARIKKARAMNKITDKYDKPLKEHLKQMDELREELDKVARPKFPPRIMEDGRKFDGRDLEEWEAKLWDDYSTLVSNYNIPVEDQMYAAFSMLREMPRGIPKEMREHITTKYPSLIGRRFGEIEEDLRPVMEELSTLISTYEDLYSKHGLDFMVSPSKMMERWGTIDYSPHLYREADEVGSNLAVYQKITKGSGRGLEQLLIREMDATKARGLAGTILEINAITNAEKGTSNIIALDPSLLWARYTQANHALTVQGFLTTLIGTGVIKGIKAGDSSLGVAVERTPGVFKTADELALELDYSPVFEFNHTQVEIERLLGGTIEDLRALYPAVDDSGVGVQRAIDSLIEEVKRPPEKGMSSWMRTSVELRQTMKAKEVLLHLRSLQAGKGVELYDALGTFRSMHKAGMDDFATKWEVKAEKLRESLSPEQFELSKNIAFDKHEGLLYSKIWEDIALEINELTRKLAPSSPKLKGKYLSALLDTDTKLWEMYIPNVIRQSMTDVLDMDPKEAGVVKKSLEWVNNFWKTRITVTAVAFTTRNWLANNVSQMFDLGPTGVLNIKTHRDGLRLANATRWKEKYGSLSAAWETLNKPLPRSASSLEKTKRAAERAWFKSTGMKSILDDGLQLTDDFWIGADELLDELVSRGVVSPAFTQVADITMAEQRILEKTLAGGAKGDAFKAAKAGKVLSKMEDALIVSVPTLMTGGIPLALPKKFGSEYFARTVENQARVFNFLSNFKKSSSFSDATAHVNKFLFNYGDLTQVQKKWMRLLVPFFTWNQKNFVLQFDLMRHSPKLFADFHRLMVDGVPQALAASQTESAGERFVNYDPLSKEKLRERETHYLHTIQLPLLSLENTALGDVSVPTIKMRRGKKGIFPWQNFDLQWGKLGKDYFPRLKNAKIQGLGLPQEAFVNSMSLLMGAADLRNWPMMPLPGDLGKQQRARAFSSRTRWIRFMGETHMLLRLASEIGSGQHMFFDKPLNELTDGRLVAEAVSAIRQVPYVGDTMGDIMAHRTGLKGYTVYDEHAQSWRNYVKVDGAKNHIWGSMPWSRNLRDAAALTDQFLLSRTIPREELAAAGISDELSELPTLYSVLDAGTGIRVKQADPMLMQAYADMRLEKQFKEYLKSIGLLKHFEESYVPFQ